ncbi:MAG: hypothetical protein M0P73_19425 [Syntrophobacterales bacterium]|jgi:hypothetical protein|nr:hypothetical protein [Syntrophobacterales bacterium]
MSVEQQWTFSQSMPGVLEITTSAKDGQYYIVVAFAPANGGHEPIQAVGKGRTLAAALKETSRYISDWAITIVQGLLSQATAMHKELEGLRTSTPQRLPEDKR